MEKVSSNTGATRPLWERQKSRRGHRSAVDGALKAHRQQKSSREQRIESRLNLVRGISQKFFPQPQIAPVIEEVQVAQQVPIQEQPIQEVAMFEPRPMDSLFNEVQMGSSKDSAIQLVDKELANPEEGPMDDIPKGSYIDYQV